MMVALRWSCRPDSIRRPRWSDYLIWASGGLATLIVVVIFFSHALADFAALVGVLGVWIVEVCVLGAYRRKQLTKLRREWAEGLEEE
jgi:Flp pilus assembly protein TadB